MGAARKKAKPIRKTTKGKGANYRSTKSGAGMTRKGVKAYRKANPGSKLKTAVTGKVKRGSKAAKRRKSYCARSLGQLKRSSAKTRNDPNSRIRQARRRWKCSMAAKKKSKKDACYSKVKSRYKVWPSAYASGALVKCRKVGAKNWGNKSKVKKAAGGLVSIRGQGAVLKNRLR